MTDEVVREVRRVRHEISRRCDHDPRRVVAYYREFQEEMKRSGEYRFCGKAAETHDAQTDQSDGDASADT
jgi:hypothetical protein